MAGRFLPEKLDYKFIKRAKFAFILSATLIVISIGSLATRGLNFGIDFAGGVQIDVQTPSAPDLDAIRGAVSALNLGQPVVQEASDPLRENAVFIRLPAQSDGPAPEGEDAAEAERAEQRAADAVKAALVRLYPDIDLSTASVAVVGPKVSNELIQDGVVALLIALAAMLLYIWVRFEKEFSLGAIAALAHDVIITLGVFSMLQMEFGLAIVAALLTIIGYSMNDTVVVFDRVREEMRKYKTMALPELLDMAINRTLSRTVMTSLTTLLALISLFVLGGQVLRGFAFAMIFGVIIGTYSSIFVAAPVLNVLGVRRQPLTDDALGVTSSS